VKGYSQFTQAHAKSISSPLDANISNINSIKFDKTSTITVISRHNSDVYEVCVKGQTEDMVLEAFLKKIQLKLKELDNEKKYGVNPEKKDKKYNRI
jgi:hypothetical protein